MSKKIFILGDSHDDLEALAKATDFIQSQEADLVFHLGDFSLRPYTVEALTEVRNTKDISSFIPKVRKHNDTQLLENKKILDDMDINYIVIPGNYDPLVEHIFKEKNLHLKSALLGETKISGYGGANAVPLHILALHELGEITPYNDEQAYNFLKAEQPHIAMLHNPAQKFVDCMFNGERSGSKEITKYILEEQPQLILSGHVHESGPLGNNPKNIKGISRYTHKTGKTTHAINPGNLGRFEMVDFPSLQTKIEFPFGTFSHVEIEDDGTPTKVVHYSLHDPEKAIGDVKVIKEYNL